MHRTYAVTWQEPEAERRSGKLELRASGLSLEGSRNGSGPVSLLLPYEELTGLRLAPGDERLDRRPTLVLDRRGSGPLRLASVAAPGIISEVAEELAQMKIGSERVGERVAVVVPIRKSKLDKVRDLLEAGPPFDPERVGLGRHQVFLTDHEAIFLFESAPGFILSRLLTDRAVWSSAAAWRDCVAGAPRVANPFFSWASAPVTGEAFATLDEGLVFGATPGPGDSDGGDVYSP
jgi:hypothetical protein